MRPPNEPCPDRFKGFHILPSPLGDVPTPIRPVVPIEKFEFVMTT